MTKGERRRIRPSIGALCLGTRVILWVVGEQRSRQVSIGHGERAWCLRDEAGRFCYERFEVKGAMRIHAKWGGWYFQMPEPALSDDLVVLPERRRLRNGFGFEWQRNAFLLNGHAARFFRA